MKLRILVLASIIAACSLSLAQDLQRPGPIIYIPPCDYREMGRAIRAFISPPPTPTPIPDHIEPEYCAGRVCDARASTLAAREYQERTIREYQLLTRLDHSAVACGY